MKTLHSETDRVIRASEISAYAFCAQAWWLGAVQGKPTSNVQLLVAGRESHERHGQRVTISNLLMRLSAVLLLLAGMAAVGWAISLLSG